MPPRLFPTHFNIILDAYQRSALEDLFELDPHLLDEVELLHDVIREGIKAMNRAAEERGDTRGIEPTRTEVEASKEARAARSWSSKSWAPTPHRHIESYIAFPIDEGLRQDLEDFLDANESLGEEEAYALLLARGLASHHEGGDEGNVPLSKRTARARRRLTLLRGLLGSAR